MDPLQLLADKRALLFDLDGTLVDSAPDLAVAVNRTLRDLDREPYPEATIRGWVGNGARVLVARALSGQTEIKSDLDSERLERALTTFHSHYSSHVCVHTRLYPGVQRAITLLKNRGLSMAIVTNKPARYVRPILIGLGLNDPFEEIVGGDTVAEKKPHPGPLLYAADKLGVSVSQCVMVGDSKNDILAAQKAGMATVGITYGYNYGESITKYNPDLVVDSLEALL